MIQQFIVQRVVLVAAALCCLATLGNPVHASIKIGMVLPLSGPLAATGKDIAMGTQAAIEAINRAGGIKGSTVELLIEDDKFDAKLSESLSNDLVKNKNVSALMSCFGTVSCLAVARVAQETGVPLLGPIAGAEALRDNKQSKVYSIRANAGEEVGVLLKYLAGIRQSSAAVVVQKDGFGNAYEASLKTVAPTYGFKPSLQIAFDPKAPNYADIAKQLTAGEEVASVVLIANTVHSVGIIKALTDAKYFGQILNLAGQANAAFVKGLAGSSQLLVFATVTPSPFGLSSPAATAYRADWRGLAGNESYSYISFEAYLNAQLMLQALRRSSDFSAAAVDKSLSQLERVSLYGLNYSFSGKRRQAASYTELAVMSKGSFKH